MFCSELGYFKTEVGSIDHILAYARHFISENHCISLAWLRHKLVQHYGTDGLFCTYDSISIFLETADGIHCIIHMFPCHAVFCTESRFMNLGRRRNCAYATEIDLIDLE